jgi:hypothetical protein
MKEQGLGEIKGLLEKGSRGDPFMYRYSCSIDGHIKGGAFSLLAKGCPEGRGIRSGRKQL